MCGPAAGVAAVPLAGLAMNHFLGNKGGGDADYKDGPTDDIKKKMEEYRSLETDEDRTKFELKWASGGRGSASGKTKKWKQDDFFRSHGSDKHGTDFDYSKSYSNIPRPSWMSKIYKEQRKSGVDTREEVHPLYPGVVGHGGMAYQYLDGGRASRGRYRGGLGMRDR